ncbi:hypothetical protein HA466_0032860 [Hirschfeldia incana]|nr:hypothetical protein HA466_0032860 [Hirschfeldia incana]KAJ0262808.1 hypothetical protein HA466_0032860 [Hirschfeldia incana]
MCVRHITTLSPEASLQQRQEQEVKEVLAKIRRYNRLFVGDLTGFLQKLKELPLLIKRMAWHMMDPHTNTLYFHEVRIFAVKNILPSLFIRNLLKVSILFVFSYYLCPLSLVVIACIY